MDKLEPCPFCGETEEILIRENTTSPVMNRTANVISCDITHWCKPEGLPRRRIHVTGRDNVEAIAAWNTRAKTVPLSTQAALECTIEHLDGIHAGKIVVDIDVFNTLYEAARESLE